MNHNPNRRDFLSTLGATAAAAMVAPALRGADEHPAIPLGKAERCIFIWLGGGAGQIDTWDPKQIGDPKAKTPGSYYPAIDTAIPSVQVCEHLAGCAKILDRFVLVRSV